MTLTRNPSKPTFNHGAIGASFRDPDIAIFSKIALVIVAGFGQYAFEMGVVAVYIKKVRMAQKVVTID